jgi:hypothetical protein
MLIDRQNQFSDAQSVTATAASTDSIDLGSVRNIGVGEPLFIVFLVTTTFVGAGATVTPSLQTDDNSAFSSAATVRTYDTFAALTPAGTFRYYEIEPISALGTYERHIRVLYTVAGGTLTASGFTSFLAKDLAAFRAYTSGYAVQ